MGNIEEMLERQKTPFEYLVFSGGGAKGAIYSGVYSALAESGAVGMVKAVAGSSAGAISAAMVACGIPPEEFEKISKETNLKGLLGTQGFSAGPVQIGKDGTPLYGLLDKTIRTGVFNFLKGKNFGELCQSGRDRIVQQQEKLEQKKQELLNSIEQLKQQHGDNSQQISDINENIQGLDFQKQQLNKQFDKIQTIIDSNGKEFSELMEKCQAGGKILFKDLALLRLVDSEQFKDLLITAVRRDNGTLQIFSAENSPDVEIALACRASASIPIVFQPATIDGVEYVDGGYRDNVPIGYFPENESKVDSSEELEDSAEELDGFDNVALAKKQGRVLALAFGSGMDASTNVAIYSAKPFDSPSALIKFLMDVVYKTLAQVGGHFKYTETDKATLTNLRENALNTVTLDTQGISTLDFDDAQKYAGYLHIKGRFQTLEYLDNYELGKGVDKNFEQQKFLLSVYEVYDNDNLNKTFAHKMLDHIIPAKPTEKSWQDRDATLSHQAKAEALLSFCTSERWEGKDNKSPLKDYVILAATNRNKEVRNDTKALESLINTLNSPTTSSKIKEDFIQLLSIDKKQDKRLNTEKSPAKNIAEFKFTKEDFSGFLSKNKSEAFRISSQGKGVGRTKGGC
ncbi:patatin-like phospholipase family protein [Candidatus Tisiphia endosymbiont of Ptychoptera albimana]|uniref:patatin-like phospholipase family protein n=1 Tax=Candidatus Tisiphia endosymbiont of Ptychoptera albimana TaxID=3066260 RepID=UPI001D770BFF|nr:patatin-like phospholipase family protein [Rickettsia endosymbiont of Sericostoma sp. HW-2014]